MCILCHRLPDAFYVRGRNITIQNSRSTVAGVWRRWDQMVKPNARAGSVSVTTHSPRGNGFSSIRAEQPGCVDTIVQRESSESYLTADDLGGNVGQVM